MMSVMFFQWVASLLASLAAIAVAYSIGQSSPGLTTLCVFFGAALVGRLFWKNYPELGLGAFVKGSLGYLFSILLLLLGLGRLDLGTARSIADWYAQWGIGPSVGLLIMQWATVPLSFGIAAWRPRARTP